MESNKASTVWHSSTPEYPSLLDTSRDSQPSSVIRRKRLAAAHNNLGSALYDRGDREGAYGHYCEAVSLRTEAHQSIFGESSSSTENNQEETLETLIDAVLLEERMHRERTAARAPAHLDLYLLPAFQDDKESNSEIDETYFLPRTSAILIERPACDDQLEMSVTLFNMALFHSQEGNADKCSQLLSMAADLAAKSADVIKASAVLNGAARVCYVCGDLDGAASALNKALRLQQRRLNSTPRSLSDATGQSMVIYSVADTLSLMGRMHLERGGNGPSRALNLTKEALRLRRSALGNDHISVAASLHNVGVVLAANGDTEGALEHCEFFIRCASQCAGRRQYAVHIADALEAVSAIHLQGSRSKSTPCAIKCLTRSLALRRSAMGQSHPSVVVSAVRFGQVLHDLGHFKEALNVFEEALQVTSNVFGRHHELCAAVLFQMGGTQHALGDLNAALKSYEEALVTARMSLGDANPFIAHMLGIIGNVHLERGDTEDAVAIFSEAARIAGRTEEAASASNEGRTASENEPVIIPSLEQVLTMEFHPAAAAA